jgi:hypothetical protein
MVLSDLDMQKDFWNMIINFHQIFIIDILQVMEHLKNKTIIQSIMLPFGFCYNNDIVSMTDERGAGALINLVVLLELKCICSCL